METQWTIGKVAKQAGVNIQTVRFYERRGLVSPDGHRDSGYRLYEPEAAQKIRFIKNAQRLGFTLDEVAGLLRLRVSHRARCEDVKKKAQKKLIAVKEKIEALNSMRNVLEGLIRTCRNKGTTEKCPILGCLEGNQK
ncbi:MAG: heavy metal-responsive transcriptional regulator [Elusimicrobia bacterium]|nr:heavy metal-responsive transcriptional regulator [Elusimicrobiota bacterium]